MTDSTTTQPRIVRLLHEHGRAAWMLVGLLLALGLLGYVFSKVQLILLAVFVALVHAAIVTPIARWLELRGSGRGAAAGLGLLLVATVLGGGTALTTYRLVDGLPALGDQVNERRDTIMAALRRPPLELTEAEVDRVLERSLDRVVAPPSGEDGQAEDGGDTGTQTADGTSDAADASDGKGPSPRTAVALLTGSVIALRLAGVGLVGVVLSFFLVRDRERITQGLVRHLAGGEHDQRALEVMREGWHALLGYVRASVIIGAFEAVVIGVTMFVVGTPLAASVTLLTFLAAFVPVAGATVAGVLAVGLTWLGVGSTQAIVVGVVVVVVQQLDSHVLQPFVVARHTRLHPAATILALLLGGLVIGPLGALLAVPVAAVLAAVAGELLAPSEPTAVDVA